MMRRFAMHYSREDGVLVFNHEGDVETVEGDLALLYEDDGTLHCHGSLEKVRACSEDMVTKFASIGMQRATAGLKMVVIPNDMLDEAVVCEINRCLSVLGYVSNLEDRLLAMSTGLPPP